LKAFGWDDRRFVFEGQGPYFRVVDDTTGVVSAQIQAFKRNNVHGFITLNQHRQDHGRGHVRIIVWGGRSVRVIDLCMGPGAEVSLSISSAEFHAPDWIMSGCASAENGHHGAFMITANNAVIGLELHSGQTSKGETVISIHQLATSVKSILYSAHVIALSPFHVLMASGTVFGEIIVWSCFLSGGEIRQANAVASIHHFFTGHDGSIFDVRISPPIASLGTGQPGRLLASCSDDRTVRIWDISDCERKTAQDPSAYSTDGYDLRSTGFGPVEEGEKAVGSESCVVQAFGHIARIWGVHFRSIQQDDQTGMGLVSRGEDSTCIMWDLTWHSTPSGAMQWKLSQASSLHPHYGKHIWSLDLCRLGSETIVYTGGADGALKSFAIEENDDRFREKKDFTPEQTPALSKRSQKSEGLKASTFVSHDCLLGSTAQGQIQLGYLNGTETNITWKELCTEPELGSWVLMASEPRKGLALISNARGLIRLYNHDTKSIVKITELGTRPLNLFFLETHSPELEHSNPSNGFTFLVCYTAEEKITLVTISDKNSDCPIVGTSTIGVPPSFVAASAALVFSGHYLAVGSKGGGLAIFKTFDADLSSRPVLLDRRVHGKEFVNHLSLISSVAVSNGSSFEYLLSCGRDGTYCVHELELRDDREETVSMQIVHRTASLVGGNIEGGYFDKTTGQFMLYGFRSQDFVLRNESKLTDVVSIASGGFRRAWAFHPGTEDSDALFTWRDQGALQTTRIRHDARCLLRAGAHGRELKSIDVFNPIGGQPLLATGAEDTTVRLFKSASSMTASSTTAFECLRVLDTHRSGIQQVTWSKCGRYLFTSAAYEEFFVWRISEVPSFGIATKLIAASPKDDANSDLRIPSFDILEVEDHDGERSFIVCLALANSTLKVCRSNSLNLFLN
jgi:WD40 repeat protein